MYLDINEKKLGKSAYANDDNDDEFHNVKFTKDFSQKNIIQKLKQSDFLVVCCDLNSKTEGMLGKKELESMKKEAVLINVARGRVVDEQALYQVLLDQKIGGAVIDVWYNYIGADKKEVWPSNYPFQDLENVILSAHESAWTREQIERRWKFIAGNLERVEQNITPENLVFYGEQ